jgi:hypothetical protein
VKPRHRLHGGSWYKDQYLPRQTSYGGGDGGEMASTAPKSRKCGLVPKHQHQTNHDRQRWNLTDISYTLDCEAGGYSYNAAWEIEVTRDMPVDINNSSREDGMYKDWE